MFYHHTNILVNSKFEINVPTNNNDSLVIGKPPPNDSSCCKNNSGYTIQVGNILFNMIRIEGGTLEIGATQEQLAVAEGNEYPAHSITLPTYYIGQFPVTQNLWEMVMRYNHSHNQQSEKELERSRLQMAFMNSCR